MKSTTSHNIESTPVNDDNTEVIEAPKVVAPHTLKKKKKPYKLKPTAKQLALAELLLNNIDNKPLSVLMRKAGYSEASVINGKKITEAKTFVQLMDDYGMTDTRLNEVLSDGLAAMDYVKTERVEGVGKNRVKTEEITPVPSLALRHKYLETALKVKGMTQPKERTPVGNTYNTFIQQNNLDPNSPEQKGIVDNTLDMLMQATKRPSN